MGYNTLTFEEPEAEIGLITLNRPKRLNAISLEMVEDLSALFNQLQDRTDVRVLILSGAGRGFCSGADLKDERIMSEEGLALFSAAAVHLEGIQQKFSGIITGMRHLPQPVIAAVNGPAAGGGMCMALAADVIIAGPDAAFTPSFINIGLSGGELGSTYFLPRLVGSARASEILMTGRTVGAQEADKIGLISRLVDAGQVMPAALETARTLLSKTPLGLRLTKTAIRQNLNTPSLEDAIELENRNQSICCCTPDFFNAVMAFVKPPKD
jgi:enoyl-CoA hydratase